LTSSADLEKLANPHKLQRFIIDHAAPLFRYADNIRTLDDDESLYFITGCIKSDSWALAAFKDPAYPPNNILNLVRKGSVYRWTTQAMAEVRAGSNASGDKNAYHGKDQTLFLQGFKLAFTPECRSRVRGPYHHGSGASDAEDGHPDFDHFDNSHERHGPDDSFGGGSGRTTWGDGTSNGFSGGSGSQRNTEGGASEDISLEKFPSTKTEVVSVTHLEVTGTNTPPIQATLHPCDIINQYLLHKVCRDHYQHFHTIKYDGRLGRTAR
jgi:hypothetical protein